MEENRIIVETMNPREPQNWTKTREKTNKQDKRPLRHSVIFAAVSLFALSGAWITLRNTDSLKTVMSHISAGFEYDHTLGRLQLVSNILPESAMVFLQKNTDLQCMNIVEPPVSLIHAWTAEEPWIEYSYSGDVKSCMSGEVTAVVKNRENIYTVRILHDKGYESIYSGLEGVEINEGDWVETGYTLGISAGTTAFEWREMGLSIQPVFGDSF